MEPMKLMDMFLYELKKLADNPDVMPPRSDMGICGNITHGWGFSGGFRKQIEAD